MWLLKNIDINKLPDLLMIDIALAMGYKKSMPEGKVNKYYYKYKINPKDKDFWEEQFRIGKEYFIEYEKYMDDVFEWLKENDYMEETYD